MPKLRKENRELKEINKQLKDEIKIIDWYNMVMEDGMDTRDVLEEYSKLKIAHKKMLKKTKDQISELKAEGKKLTNQLNTTMKFL